MLVVVVMVLELHIGDDADDMEGEGGELCGIR